MERFSYLQWKNYRKSASASKNGKPIHSTIDHLPATLDLHEGLASPGDADILKVALELKLNARDRHEGTGPQGGVDSARLLHGLWLSISLETSELERSVAKKGVVMCEGLSQRQVGRTARDYCASPDSGVRTTTLTIHFLIFRPFCCLNSVDMVDAGYSFDLNLVYYLKSIGY